MSTSIQNDPLTLFYNETENFKNSAIGVDYNTFLTSLLEPSIMYPIYIHNIFKITKYIVKNNFDKQKISSRDFNDTVDKYFKQQKITKLTYLKTLLNENFSEFEKSWSFFENEWEEDQQKYNYKRDSKLPIPTILQIEENWEILNNFIEISFKFIFIYIQTRIDENICNYDEKKKILEKYFIELGTQLNKQKDFNYKDDSNNSRNKDLLNLKDLINNSFTIIRDFLNIPIDDILGPPPQFSIKKEFQNVNNELENSIKKSDKNILKAFYGDFKFGYIFSLFNIIHTYNKDIIKDTKFDIKYISVEKKKNFNEYNKLTTTGSTKKPHNDDIFNNIETIFKTLIDLDNEMDENKIKNSLIVVQNILKNEKGTKDKDTIKNMFFNKYKGFPKKQWNCERFYDLFLCILSTIFYYKLKQNIGFKNINLSDYINYNSKNVDIDNSFKFPAGVNKSDYESYKDSMNNIFKICKKIIEALDNDNDNINTNDTPVIDTINEAINETTTPYVNTSSIYPSSSEKTNFENSDLIEYLDSVKFLFTNLQVCKRKPSKKYLVEKYNDKIIDILIKKINVFLESIPNIEPYRYSSDDLDWVKEDEVVAVPVNLNAKQEDTDIVSTTNQKEVVQTGKGASDAEDVRDIYLRIREYMKKISSDAKKTYKRYEQFLRDNYISRARYIESWHKIIRDRMKKEPTYDEYSKALEKEEELKALKEKLKSEIDVFTKIIKTFDADMILVNATLDKIRSDMDVAPIKEEAANIKKKLANMKDKLLSLLNVDYNIMDIILDTKFYLVYILKAFSYLCLLAAIYLTEKIFTEMYMKKVFAENKEPPSILTMVGIFLAFYVVILMVFATILLLLDKIVNAALDDFIINGRVLTAFFMDTVLFIIVLSICLITIGSIMQLKRYFRYKTEGLRAIRAFKTIIIYLALILIFIPFFVIF